MTDEPPRVVITGLGAVSPLGRGADSLWRALLEGQSAVGTLSGLDAPDLGPQVAAQIRDYAPPPGLDSSLVGLRRPHLLAVDAALLAVADARLPIVPQTAGQVAVVVGSALGGDPSGPVARALGAQGPAFTALAGACSGTWALGLGAAIIRRRQVMAAVCGGTEAPLTPEVLHHFEARGLLSHRRQEPAGACRPFDAAHDGTVLGEGAAFLVLEERDLALSRGAPVYAEVVGLGAAHQSDGETPDPVTAGEALRSALMERPLLQGEIDLYWACAPGIPEHDRLETTAVKRFFGGGAYRLAVAASKGATGHLLGASGALEAMACALALRHQTIPPAVNCDQPDPECDLDIVRGGPRQERLTNAISYAFGPDLPAGQAGGHHACLILAAPAD